MIRAPQAGCETGSPGAAAARGGVLAAGTVAALLAGQTEAQEQADRSGGLVADFAAVCLDTLPHFDGAPAAFAAVGYPPAPAEPVDGTQRPILRFGVLSEGDGAVQRRRQMPAGDVSSRVLTAAVGREEPDGPAFFALDAAIERRALVVYGEICSDRPGQRRCIWIWPRPGGCNAVVAASLGGVVQTLFATGIDTQQDCAEGLP